MKTYSAYKNPQAQQGGVIMTVIVLCTAMLIISAAFFETLTAGRRLNHKVLLATEAREGAEATLALASAEINRRAVAIASFEAASMTGYALETADVTFLAGSGAKSNLVSSALGVKVGRFSANVRSGVTLLPNDPAYSRDDSKGLTVGVRYGEIFATAATKDPVTNQTTSAYVAGMIQLRERAWFNYGFFFNMDMEVFPGPPMHVKGAIHTNADLYLGKDGTGDGLYLYRIATAAGHIYRGVKYCLKNYNADGTLTGFQNKTNWNTGTHEGEGNGHVYCTIDGSNTQPTTEFLWDEDCLGIVTNTNPASNEDPWRTVQNTKFAGFLKDKLAGAAVFSPPDLPLYVPENYETGGTTELRNHGYAMIEPQLPSTDNNRYYGRKTTGAENLKLSALAGLTIVVSDPDRDKVALDAGSTDTTLAGADYMVNMSRYGKAIPWKLVWYRGATNSGLPINKENLPARGLDGLPVPYSLDPFDKNDEVDLAGGLCTAAQVKMQRNLKALLRDCIVVVPYRDSLATITAGIETMGTGSTAANIASYPVDVTVTGDTIARIPGSGDTRYSQKAGSWPKLSTGATTNPPTTPVNYSTIAAKTTASNSYVADSYAKIISTTDSYPTSSTVAASNIILNMSAGVYSGVYDRRQGFNGTLAVNVTAPTIGATSASTNYNSLAAGGGTDLKGALHMVYIDLQKLNWILNHSELWRHPATGDPIYVPSTSYTNIIYVDLPSAYKTASRHGGATGVANTEPDKICPARKPGDPALTTTIGSPKPGPGYGVLLHHGGRLPRLSYDDANVTPGFTLATNGPLYIKGNYNADGESSTGDSLLPDSDARGALTSNTALWYSAANPNAEVPAMAAGDCVVFLSEGFRTNLSNKNKYLGSALSDTADCNAFTPIPPRVMRYHGYAGNATVVDDNFLEISTAIVTGLTPTIPDRAPGNTGKNTQSGAINNLPRFLEDHGGQTVCYRGSMAALYDCEVMTSRFIQGSHDYWFDPPTRDWGYHQYLAAAKYPPGTPVVRTARLINMRGITATEYATGPIQPSE